MIAHSRSGEIAKQNHRGISLWLPRSLFVKNAHTFALIYVSTASHGANKRKSTCASLRDSISCETVKWSVSCVKHIKSYESVSFNHCILRYYICVYVFSSVYVYMCTIQFFFLFFFLIRYSIIVQKCCSVFFYMLEIQTCVRAWMRVGSAESSANESCRVINQCVRR